MSLESWCPSHGVCAGAHVLGCVEGVLLVASLVASLEATRTSLPGQLAEVLISAWPGFKSPGGPRVRL